MFVPQRYVLFLTFPNIFIYIKTTKTDYTDVIHIQILYKDSVVFATISPLVVFCIPLENIEYISESAPD